MLKNVERKHLQVVLSQDLSRLVCVFATSYGWDALFLVRVCQGLLKYSKRLKDGCVVMIQISLSLAMEMVQVS